MTQEQAMAEQERIVKDGYKLGWWYGTNCRKCCGVFPKFMKAYTAAGGKCFYQCDVCGRKSGLHEMPWLARDDWNEMDFSPIPV